MNNVLNEYRNIAGFLRNSLGNLYKIFVLEYKDNELQSVESDYVDSEDVKNCLVLMSECARHKKTYADQMTDTHTGRITKISVQVIYGEEGEIVGALCILLPCGPFLKLMGLANEFLRCETQNEVHNAVYPSTMEGIERYINDFAIQSSKPTRNEKTEIICDLYDMGMFRIKGAVAKVAEMLQMSTKSVYRYIKEIEEARR